MYRFAAIASAALILGLAADVPPASAGRPNSPACCDAVSKDAAAKKLFDEAVESLKKQAYNKAVEQFREAAELYKATSNVAGQIQALTRAGLVFQYNQKKFDKALEMYTSALTLARSSGDHVLLAEALDRVAFAERRLGHQTPSITAYEEALAIHEAAADYQNVVSTLTKMGATYQEFHDETKAAEYRERAEQVRAKHNVPYRSMRVSGGVLDSKVTHREQPVYPPDAGRDRITGPVVVEVTVGTDGRVEKVQPISGHPALRQAAIDAAGKWIFEPMSLSGESIRMIGTITFNFAR